MPVLLIRIDVCKAYDENSRYGNSIRPTNTPLYELTPPSDVRFRGFGHVRKVCVSLTVSSLQRFRDRLLDLSGGEMQGTHRQPFTAQLAIAHKSTPF